MSARRWGLPSLDVAIWLAFFLALTCSQARVAMISADGDPCWHWRQGNWMIEHRAILQTDEFTHTRYGAPMVESWWLSEIVFAVAGNALGWFGVVVLSAALIATTLWLLYRQLLGEGAGVLVATSLTLLAAAVCASHWLARPHLVTHLLTVVFAGRLRKFQRGEISTGQLFGWLVPLTALWANLHGAFVTAFVLIAVYAAGNLTHRLRAGTLVALLGACGVASLLNPNGWRLLAHVVAVLRNDVVVGFVQEYARPNFQQPGHWGLLLLLVVLALTFLVGRPKLTGTEVLLVAVFGFLALRVARNAPSFALIVTPIIAKPLSACFKMRRPDVGQLSGTGWPAVALVVMILVGPKWLPTAIPADKYPVAAVEFLRNHPGTVQGEMFNDVTWGGYFVWALPEHKVFIDGRVESEGLITDFNTVDEVQSGWEAVLAKYRVGWTILPRSHRLNGVLARHPLWRPAYSDAVTTIYTRSAT